MGIFIDLRHPLSVRNVVSVFLLVCTLISRQISAQGRNGANGNGDYGEEDIYDYEPEYDERKWLYMTSILLFSILTHMLITRVG